MTSNLAVPEDMTLRLPITSQAIEFGRQFSQAQPTQITRERLNLNTLAVYTVHNYLEMMGFRTNLQAGDSWNPIARMCADVADLEVLGIGKLECRPVKPGEREYIIPPEVWLDRIAYAFVQIDLDTREATILGFTPQARATIAPDRLRSVEELIDRLHDLMETPMVKLDRWLQGAIDTAWQTIEALFPTSELAFRSEPNQIVRRAKSIDLGIQLQSYSVALIVELIPESNDERTQIRLQVRPIDRIYLPPDLQLIVLDDTDTVFLEAQSRTADNLIQLQFTGNIGENFRVNIALGTAQIIEQFMI
jgi:hypothetical protein